MGRICVRRNGYNQIISRDEKTGTRGDVKRSLPEMMDCQIRKRTRMDHGRSSKLQQWPISSIVEKKVDRPRHHCPEIPRSDLPVLKRSNIRNNEITNKCEDQDLKRAFESTWKSSDTKWNRESSETLAGNAVHSPRTTCLSELSVPKISSLSHKEVSALESVDITLATDAALAEGYQESLSDVQLSPKALRALTLKHRFADTIFKAKQTLLFDHSFKADPVKMQQKSKELERSHIAEKTRIECKLKAIDEASLLSMNKRREQDREAARMVLDKMERTVEFDDNILVQAEFERLLSGVY